MISRQQQRQRGAKIVVAAVSDDLPVRAHGRCVCIRAVRLGAQFDGIVQCVGGECCFRGDQCIMFV
eukprot:SAG31_NODE_1987_length_6724_cov_18.235925_8_plen_66_part_00